VQLYRYFVSQSSEFCCHNPLCCFSTSVYRCLLRYRLSPETYGYHNTYIHTYFTYLLTKCMIVCGSCLWEVTQWRIRLYCRRFGDPYHPRLLAFMMETVRIFEMSSLQPKSALNYHPGTGSTAWNFRWS